MKPFVDYYKENAISPVAQDISDLRRHFDRREALYRMLGIAPLLVEGRTVIEFGPGSGYNAVYTAGLHPRRYVLVDANPTGLREARRLLAGVQSEAGLEFVEALIDEFTTPDSFDIVLCEGTIPFQRDPASFLRHVASFAKPGGIVVITCNDSVSFQGEATRRLIADAVAGAQSSTSSKLEALRPIFAPHLATLLGMSRPVDDWILDNIIQPLLPTTFSIEQAVSTLAGQFEAYGQSPDFVVDWRWYKQIEGTNKRYNERAIDAFHRELANLLDCRVVLPAHTVEFGRELYMRCDAVIACALDPDSAPRDRIARALPRLRDVARTIEPLSPLTAASYNALVAYLENPADASLLAPFASFFGRGQQYLSFIRTHNG